MTGTCTTCRRRLPLDAGVCRPCRRQASLVAGPGYKTALDLSVAAVTGHQLFFANTLRRLTLTRSRVVPAPPPPQPDRPRRARPRLRWVQLLLCDPPRDLTGVSSRTPPIDAELAAILLAQAARIAELRGWSRRTLSLVRRGLRILSAVHDTGEPIKASTVAQLTAGGMPCPHIIDVLSEVGVLADDRPDSLTVWLEEQLAGLPGQIRTELQVWLDLLRNGSPRRQPRERTTIVTGISSIRSFLSDVGGRYSTLRQVTRDDITTWLDDRPARSRIRDASTLRSLFGALRAERLIFANPTRGVRTGQGNPSVPTPLPSHVLSEVTAAARGNVALRVVVALTGVHALTPGGIRELLLDQVDLPNRRLDPGGLNRPLDEFTATAIGDYLTFRRRRWPRTTNPHLLVTRKTVHTGDPVSRFWMAKLFRDLPVTADKLREDRIVEEALSGQPDPLHLAAVFGFGPSTGLRYAQAARTDSSDSPPDL